MDLINIKGSWVRNQTARAIKETRKLLNRSETIEDNDCFAHPVGYPLWQQVLFVIFLLSVFIIGSFAVARAGI